MMNRVLLVFPLLAFGGLSSDVLEYYPANDDADDKPDNGADKDRVHSPPTKI